MGLSRRDQCALWIVGSGFAMQDHKASESIVATPWSGGGNVGARGHDADHLSLFV